MLGLQFVPGIVWVNRSGGERPMSVWRYVHKAAKHLALSLVVLLTSSCVLKLTPTPEPVVLRFAYRQNTAAMKPLLEAFQAKYPWIMVEAVEAQRWGNQLESMIENARVDIFREDSSAVRFATEGLLQPLEDLMLDQWGSIRDDYYKGAWESLSLNGQQWGVPAGLDIYVAYINADQLKALNLTAPPPDWGLFDFVELAIKMNHPEGLPTQEGTNLIGFCTTLESADPLVFVYLHGGRIVDNIANPTQATLDDPLTIEAVQWYSDLFNQHAVAPNSTTIQEKFPRGGVYEAAIMGACGIWLDWYSDRGGLNTPYKWAFTWKMLPLPRDRGNFSYGAVDGYFITKNCQHPVEAAKLLRFLSDYSEAAGQKLPPRHSMVEAESYKKVVGEDVMAIARDSVDNLVLLPYSQSTALAQLEQIIFAALGQIIDQDLNAADVLAEAQDQCRAIFEK